MAETKKTTDNLEYWNSWKEVPENAKKAFDNGNFKGTDINTMWRLKCLTEKFGMCGFGWYYNLKRTWVETTNNGEQFAFAEIELFVKIGEEWSKPISGNGGNKLLRKTQKGDKASDEAFKMAITDAIGVACRNLGIGADVYWENDKYTESAYEEPHEAEKTTSMATQEQIAEIFALKCNMANVRMAYNVSRLADLTYDQANEVIQKKRASLAEANNED